MTAGTAAEASAAAGGGASAGTPAPLSGPLVTPSGPARNSAPPPGTTPSSAAPPALGPGRVSLESSDAAGKYLAVVDDVVVLRTVNGRKMAGLYNVDAIRRGAYDDPAIYANDVIVVGDSPQRRLFRDLVSLSPVLAAPLIAILQ